MQPVAYCPQCGSEIVPYEYEFYTGHIIWDYCNNENCYWYDFRVKSDCSGFVLEPGQIRGRYLFKRTIPKLREKRKRR